MKTKINKILLIVVVLLQAATTKAQWSVINTGFGKRLNDVCFASPNIGFAIGNDDGGHVVILRTLDGGNNWTVLPFPVSVGGVHTYKIQCVDTSIAFVWISKKPLTFSGNYINEVYKTVDKGTTWTQDVSFPMIPVYYLPTVNMQIITANHWIVFNNSGDYGDSLQIAKTYNAGISWQYSYLTLPSVFPTGLYTSVAFVDTSNFHVGGWDGSLFNRGFTKNTIDGGVNWTTSNEISQPPFNIQFTDKNTGFFTTNGSLFNTTDGGNNWDTISITSPNPTMGGTDRGVCFVDANNGFINTSCGFCGFDPGVYKTINGGKDWVLDYNTTGMDFFMSEIKPHFGSLYIAGGNGLILKKDITTGINHPKKKNELNLSIFPNPFSARTTILIDQIIPTDKRIAVKIVDVMGKEVFVLADAHGNEFNIEKNNLNPGIYFCQVYVAGELNCSKKLVVN